MNWIREYFPEVWERCKRIRPVFLIPTSPFTLIESQIIVGIARLKSRHAPELIICSDCKQPLNTRLKARALLRSICWRCHYQHAGGKWIELVNSVKTLQIFKDAFGVPVPAMDKIWNNLEIYKGLVRNGQIAMEARNRPGVSASFTLQERCTILEVRQLARDNGMSERFINMTEMEGWTA